MISFLKEKIQIKDKDDVMKLHIIVKSFEKEFKLSMSDVDTLLELYHVGYTDKFYENCVEKGYFKSKQTVRNSISKMTNLGILSYKKRGERVIDKEFILDIQGEKVIMQYLVGNL